MFNIRVGLKGCCRCDERTRLRDREKEGQSLLGYVNAAAGLVLALTAPFLGAIADKSGRRKPWVMATTAVMIVGASMLWLIVPDGEGSRIIPGLALLLVIGVAFSVSEMFHNAMLPSIAPISKVGVISGTAFALGNVGGLLLMFLVLFAFALPDVPLFGIDQATHEHDRIVGPIAGVWMLVFTLPLLLFTPDGKSSGIPMWSAAKQGVRDVMSTLRQLKHYSNIGIYLLARMFFIDGMVGVMIFGGVYASGTFGWDTTTLLVFGLCTSASAMFGAYVGGRLDDKVGSIRALQIAITVSSVVLLALVSVEADKVLYVVSVSTQPLWAFPYFQTTAEFFYFCTNQVFAMFFVTGLSSSRTLMARICPPQMATQFFGLFALSGTVTAFLAPLLVATTTAYFQSQRIGFGSLALLMVIGAGLLLNVREEQATVAS
ncbi:MAG: MFS transporter [Gammaproteobacteria bacterium]|nr:MFS transporter [Gammaproteobacteria bacterium]